MTKVFVLGLQTFHNVKINHMKMSIFSDQKIGIMYCFEVLLIDYFIFNISVSNPPIPFLLNIQFFCIERYHWNQ